jgi:hypothetical protein
VAHARGRVRQFIWDGAAGPVAALIALAATTSLLQWRLIVFVLGPLEVPAWVMLLSNGALQLHWTLPRRHPLEPSLPRQRLLSSSWFWGTVLGIAWALISHGLALLRKLT